MQQAEPACGSTGWVLLVQARAVDRTRAHRRQPILGPFCSVMSVWRRQVCLPGTIFHRTFDSYVNHNVSV